MGIKLFCIQIKDLAADEIVWGKTDSNYFMPAAVIKTDVQFVTVAVFDVDKPANSRKLRRNQVIPAFNDALNADLLVNLTI